MKGQTASILTPERYHLLWGFRILFGGTAVFVVATAASLMWFAHTSEKY